MSHEGFHQHREAPSEKNPYEILGLMPGASNEQIKSAFRTLAKEYHPDIHNDPEKTVILREIYDAHKILTTPEKKKDLDSKIAAKAHKRETQRSREKQYPLTIQDDIFGEKVFLVDVDGGRVGESYEKLTDIGNFFLAQTDTDMVLLHRYSGARLTEKCHKIEISKGFLVATMQDGKAALLDQVTGEQLGFPVDKIYTSEQCVIAVQNGFWFMLDPNTGEQMSESYSKFLNLDKEGNYLMGQKAMLWYLMDKNTGAPYSEGYTKIKPLEHGLYVGHNAIGYQLFDPANGRVFGGKTYDSIYSENEIIYGVHRGKVDVLVK